MSPKALFTASTYSHIVHFHRPYLQALNRQGWVVDIACGGAPLPIPEARRCIQLPFQKSITAPANFKAAAMLRKELKAEGYDLISTHTSLAAFFTRLAARGLNTIVINTCHGYLFDKDTPAARCALLLGAEQLTARRTDLLLTMNHQDYEIAQAHHLSRRILPIPGVGVDFSRLEHTPPDAGDALRAEWNIPQNAFVLLYPAEFSARKSQATLLHALTLLPPTVVLLLPGQGALLEDCKALARELGVEERVIFPGYVSDMGSWYRAADCAVTSSRSEGLPFNVMEAMGAGLPVVVSRVKGHEDLVTDGETGFLFPYGDARACADAVQRLLDEPALVKTLGQRGQEAVAAYSLEQVLPQVLDAYATVVPALKEPVQV